MKLIVGLGNPGARYEPTRHNLGFRIVDQLARQNKILFVHRCCDAVVGEGALDGEKLVLAKPQTFMNRSGPAVESLLKEYRAESQDLVVIYDDLDLPFGRIRIRASGGAGGHRGVASIIESLAGREFNRVRVGIGRPPEGMDPVDFVLAPFGKEELDQLDAVVERAAAAATCLAREGLKRAMDLYNRAV